MTTIATKPLPDGHERDTYSIKCDCGGRAEEVKTTDEERKKFGCGRSYSCCDVAFVCVVCGQRYAGQQPAPDMDYSYL